MMQAAEPTTSATFALSWLWALSGVGSAAVATLALLLIGFSTVRLDPIRGVWVLARNLNTWIVLVALDALIGCIVGLLILATGPTRPASVIGFVQNNPWAGFFAIGVGSWFIFPTFYIASKELRKQQTMLSADLTHFQKSADVRKRYVNARGLPARWFADLAFFRAGALERLVIQMRLSRQRVSRDRGPWNDMQTSLDILSNLALTPGVDVPDRFRSVPHQIESLCELTSFGDAIKDELASCSAAMTLNDYVQNLRVIVRRSYALCEYATLNTIRMMLESEIAADKSEDIAA